MKGKYILWICLSLIAEKIVGQKKIIDVSACDEWEHIEEIGGKACLSSPDGSSFLYKVSSGRNGSVTVLKNLKLGTERRFLSAYNEQPFDGDRMFSFQLPGDTLVIYDTQKNNYSYLLGIKLYFIIKSNVSDLLAYFTEQGGKTHLKIWDMRKAKEMDLADVDMVKHWHNKQGTAVLIKGLDGLTYIDLRNWKRVLITSDVSVENSAFSDNGNEIAYITRNENRLELRCLNLASAVSRVLIDSSSDYLKNWKLESSELFFGNDDVSIFFRISPINSSSLQQDSVITRDVNVWSYQDSYLQDKQLHDLFKKRTLAAMINIDNGKFTQIEFDNLSLATLGNSSKYFILTTPINENEFYWNKETMSMFLFSAITGDKVLVAKSGHPGFRPIGISPDNKFLVWFNGSDANYYSYNIASGRTSNISNFDDGSLRMSLQRHEAAGVIGWPDPYSTQYWINNGSALIVNSKNDIWQLDPLGVQAPINLTNGYGASNDIRFRVIDNDTAIIRLDKKELLVGAFDNRSKQNGFWKIFVGRSSEPIKLIMSDDAYFFSPQAPIVSISSAEDPTRFKPVKAFKRNLFVVRIMNSSKAPNLYYTTNFKKFTQLTNVNPNKDYVWPTTKLIKWTLPNGQKAEGILHRPDNFDSTRKYPIIFNYYERRSECLNVFRTPGLSGHNINIPWYISRGYLIFEPDFYYKRGKTAESVINSVKSALIELKKIPYIDQNRMGIQGQSHGGYETNILATGTQLFKAACEMAGFTDIISEYGSIRPGGWNNQMAADLGQRNLGVFPWEHPEVFIESSPVFHVSKMTAPLLMVHNKDDGAVSFSQAIELYLAMRRIGKEVWMLQYDGEGHSIEKEWNQLDFTIRMQQFFDHYLKDAPMPLWMSKGIPASLKGKVSGLQYETSPISRTR